MMGEEWRPCFDGFYEVSDVGRVRRLAPASGTRPGLVLSQRDDLRSGYRTVGLKGSGSQTTAYVHRLVAEAFIGPCPEGHQVNHRNGVKSDNRASNLEYVTPAQNIRHAWRNGLARRVVGTETGSAKVTEDDVREIRRRRRNGELLEEIAEDFPITGTTVWSIVHRKTWRHVA